MTNFDLKTASSINDKGEVAGGAYIWRNGVSTFLGSLGGSQGCTAEGINNNSQVVGWGEVVAYSLEAFIWQDGVITNIGTLGGRESEAHAINNNGQAVGWANAIINNDTKFAFVWQNGVMTNLGLGEAFGINDNGMIVGSSGSNACMWQNQARTDIGKLDGS